MYLHERQCGPPFSVLFVQNGRLFFTVVMSVDLYKINAHNGKTQDNYKNLKITLGRITVRYSLNG